MDDSSNKLNKYIVKLPESNKGNYNRPNKNIPAKGNSDGEGELHGNGSPNKSPNPRTHLSYSADNPRNYAHRSDQTLSRRMPLVLNPSRNSSPLPVESASSSSGFAGLDPSGYTSDEGDVVSTQVLGDALRMGTERLTELGEEYPDLDAIGGV